MLKSSVQLRLGQNLTMTPQLQQAIRLLQLSTLELQAQIQETLETNPMLEAEDGNESGAETDEDSLETSALPGAEPSDHYDASGNPEAEVIPEELPVDSQWDDIYDMPVSFGSADSEQTLDVFENQTGPGESLQDHLLWQLNLSPMNDRDRSIAITLIDAINDDGYLGEPLENIYAGLMAQGMSDLEMDEVEAVLRRVQYLDPVGVGARSLAECLSLQLLQFDASTPHLDLARTMVSDYLDQIGARDFRRVQKQLGIDDEVLKATIQLIQSLNPRPGALISSTSTEYVIPDVFVRRVGETWRVELNPDIAPRLRINPLYASFVRRADTSQDNQYLRDNLQEARWFIKSLQSRNETLLRVATAIVEHQRSFLEQGDEAMKPLVLRDIAEQLEMHESTISRVTTQKFMHTPRGVYEFKHFFSSHVGTADGGECSATAIRAMIRKLVAEEPQGKPMSDSKIAHILVDRGIHVARRTVAKYREAMDIPPSNERKSLL